jgi:hypothetical protein
MRGGPVHGWNLRQSKLSPHGYRLAHPVEYNLVHRSTNAGAGPIWMNGIQPDFAYRRIAVQLN